MVRPIQNLHLRLLLPFALVLISATALAWWTATSLLTRTLEQRLEEQMTHAGGVLGEGGFPLTEDLLQRLGRLLNAEITLIDGDGAPGPTTLGAESRLRESLAKSWLAAMESGRSVKVWDGTTPFQLIVRPLALNRDPRYRAVAVTASLGDLRDAARQAAIWLGVAALLGALALAWIGHRIVLGITQPVRQLAWMADRIAGGDREVRVEIDQANEVGGLADALNGMAQRLGVYEQEMARQNRLAALGKMAARIAHEIRNPLTAIKLQLQLLAESLAGDTRDTADALLNEVRRLELIVAGTLHEVRQAPLMLRPADLNALVEEVTRLFRPQFAHRNIRLATNLPESLPRALLDPDRVKQILVNLLVNAADALVDGGEILVETDRIAGQPRLTLAVDDSGPGIPPQHRKSLFSGDFNDQPGESGIGLRLSRELTELHGGQIAISDSTLGGARILVSFPMEDENRR